MKTLSVVTLALMMSFAANASGSILDLDVGDKLVGTDIVSQQNCSIEIAQRSVAKRKVNMTLVLTVGETTYQPFEVTERFVIGRTTLFKQLSKVIDNVAWNTVTVDATLQEAQITGNRSFRLERTVWTGSYYSPKKVINCKF